MTKLIRKTMNRREFTKAGGLIGAALSLPGCSQIGLAENGTQPSSKVNTTNQPDWAIGYQDAVAHELETESLELVYGKLPSDLRGRFYRNGPALFERDGLKMNHWFDGDGMLQMFEIESGNVRHKGSMLKTTKYLSDSKAGRFTTNNFATTVPDPSPILGPDDMNVSNTSVMSVGGEMFALWEGGSAFQVDPLTLSPLGSKTWGDGLKGMPFSAHPKFERDGSLWNFGQDVFSERLIIYRISATGQLMKVDLLPDVPGGMIHDFCMTDKHLVFVVPSFRVTQRAATFLDMFSWQAQQAQDVIVVDKNDLSNRRQYELPPGFQFHFGNAYEENGDIIYSACVGNDRFVTAGARDVLNGRMPERADTQLMTMRLAKNGSAKVVNEISALAEHEFPQFNPLYQGRRAQYLYTIGKSYPDRAGESAIIKHDLDNGDYDFYDYGEHHIAEEHLFVPRSSQASEDDGYLIGTALDFKNQRTQLNVLDAKNIKAGPIAVLRLPYYLPVGFHGAWVNMS